MQCIYIASYQVLKAYIKFDIGIKPILGWNNSFFFLNLQGKP